MENEGLYQRGVHPERGDEIRACRFNRRMPGAVGVQEKTVTCCVYSVYEFVVQSVQRFL